MTKISKTRHVTKKGVVKRNPTKRPATTYVVFIDEGEYDEVYFNKGGGHSIMKAYLIADSNIPDINDNAAILKLQTKIDNNRIKVYGTKKVKVVFDEDNDVVSSGNVVVLYPEI